VQVGPSPQHRPAACPRAMTVLDLSRPVLLRPMDIPWQQADAGPAVKMDLPEGGLTGESTDAYMVLIARGPVAF
jgi:hypothetical protein